MSITLRGSLRLRAVSLKLSYHIVPRRPMASSSSTAAGPVRLVLFDIFDTLCTPRMPIYEQYHEEVLKTSLHSSSISPESIRQGFKIAYKEMNQIWPLYGKHTDPPTAPEDWWAELIRRCMVHAGGDEQEVLQVMPRLGPALLERFESDEGYEPFPEALTTLVRLRRKGVKVSLVSNADPRILKTLDALSITHLLSYPPTLSWDVELSKPDPAIFQKACESCGESVGEGVIMVGDELKADYRGAINAGLEARLIRRPGEWSDGAVRAPEEDLQGVHVIRDLDEVVQEVDRRNLTQNPGRPPDKPA
ncbi:HAD-like domain-containing protein [Kockovaella imperatae]|uniref:HAD-like domain-containing protein n=1 Tax=Kockovaella imperatae TaxID=4999 RepID=A0A1Y1UUJ8_9TREE|nr:HAD-like domain-containing protein [Kockovaella imperatae]ORX40875.1 HAD-like domain-containing protein [Kockovaella imperatae]